MNNIRTRRLNQSTIVQCRLSINCSVTSQEKNMQQLEESFYQVNQKSQDKQHTQPILNQKKGLLEQIYAALNEKQNNSMRNSILMQTQQALVVRKSNKTLKLKSHSKKKVQRKQSVLERDLHQNCMIKGIWIETEQVWSPQFREFGKMETHQGIVYLSGGFGNSVNGDFCSYNIVSSKWQMHKQMIPRYGHSMTSTNQGLFIIGGEQINNYGKLRSKSLVLEIQKYDGEKFQSVKYGGSFQMRKYHAAILYKDTIFIVGGEGQKNRLLNDTVLFDIYTNRFYQIAMNSTIFNKGIIHTAIVEVQDTIYLYGGVNQNDEVYNEVYTYDNYSQWKIKPTIGSKPPNLMMHTMVYFEPYILIYGGKVNENQTSFSNEIYALKKDEWFIIDQSGKIPLPRAGHSCCIASDKMLVFGGFNFDGYLSCQMQIMNFERFIQINKVSSLPSLRSEPTEPLSQKRQQLLIKTRLSLLK